MQKCQKRNIISQDHSNLDGFIEQANLLCKKRPPSTPMGSCIDKRILIILGWCLKIYIDDMYVINMKSFDSHTKDSDRQVKIRYSKVLLGGKWTMKMVELMMGQKGRMNNAMQTSMYKLMAHHFQ